MTPESTLSPAVIQREMEQEIQQLNQFVADLVQIIDDENMADDPDVTRQLALIRIELDALQINLPDTAPDIREKLLALHKSRLVDGILATLQSVLGYYSLPLRETGENEPIIGPELGHKLRVQLERNEVDIYMVKHELVQRLNDHKDT